MIEKLAKLQVEIEELRSTLETATDGVVIIEQEGEIRSMNRSASALFNFDDQKPAANLSSCCLRMRARKLCSTISPGSPAMASRAC